MSQVFSLVLMFAIGFYLLPFTGIYGTHQNGSKTSPAPTASTQTDCVINHETYLVTANECQSVKDNIEMIKQKDVQAVNRIENSIKEKIATDDAEIQFLLSFGNKYAQDSNSIPKQTDSQGMARYLDDMNAATSSINDANSWIKIKTADQNNLAHYQNYAISIIIGKNGNGACSDHGGVNCAVGKGDIGQAICKDSWNQSSVYYFNIDECMRYYVNNLLGK